MPNMFHEMLESHGSENGIVEIGVLQTDVNGIVLIDMRKQHQMNE